MSFGSKDPQTTSTTVTPNLSAEQQQLIGLAMPGIKDWASRPLKRYGGSTVAGFDPSQLAGQEQLLSAAGAQKKIADNALGANNFWTSQDIWKPENNPALQGAVDAAVRPITQQLQEQVLPGIRGSAVTGGNFGSSRQGIAEGLASGRASQAIGDTASKLVNEQYRTNVDAQLKALGMAPQTQQLQLQPGITTSNVGDIRQQMSQQLLNEQVGNFNFDQNSNFLQSRELLSLLSGLPGGGTTTTAVGAKPGGNAFTSALGGAATGASLGSLFGPWGTGLGAVGGGLYGLFGK